MGGDTIFVFALIGVASILFASGRFRLDTVALLVVLALMLSRVLTIRESLSGFGDPVVIMMAGLLVVGETLTRTGIAYNIGSWMAKVGGTSETRLIVLLMVVVGLLGSVMSSTAVVAIFIPVVLNIAGRTNINASRILLPLCYAALISGMMTLIATTSNLIANAELSKAGFEDFNFFSFTPIGLSILAAGVLYMMTLGRRLMPGDRVSPPKSTVRTMQELLEEYGLYGRAQQLRVPEDSPLAGQSLAESQFSTRFGVRVYILERSERFGKKPLPTPGPDTVIHADDVLIVRDNPEAVKQLVNEAKLQPQPTSEQDRERWAQELGIATVLIHPQSQLVGSTMKEVDFTSRYGTEVLAVRRKDKILKDDFLDHKLEFGDALLIAGPWAKIGLLQASAHDFVVLALPVEIDQVAPSRDRAPVAISIVVGMVLLSAFEVVPVVVAVLLAALAAVFTRCLSMDAAYRSIHWSSLVLIAGMLPIATALQKTGGIELITNGLISGVGSSDPIKMMSALFVLTAGIGMFLSNIATAVLVVPIAVQAAQMMGISPYPLVMTVAIAASSPFASSFATPAITLVVPPGNYRFGDFLKVGLPMLIITWAVTMIVTPRVFAF